MIISDNEHAASNYEIDFTNLTHEDPSWPGCDDWGRIRHILQQCSSLHTSPGPRVGLCVRHTGWLEYNFILIF